MFKKGTENSVLMRGRDHQFKEKIGGDSPFSLERFSNLGNTEFF
jgi:hypothetical protein